jgi:hypothetical protein
MGSVWILGRLAGGDRIQLTQGRNQL